MKVALASTHPIQYQAPWLRALAASPRLDLEVGFVRIPDAAAQGAGFGVAFHWDLPLLEGYRWIELAPRASGATRGSWLGGPLLERPGRWLGQGFEALVVTGWHAPALVQLALAARRRGLPVVVRGDSRGGIRRPLAVRAAHRALLRLYSAFLVVGVRNRDFYRGYGVPERLLFSCPHFVENERFAEGAVAARPRREELRARWGVPAEAVCALFAGKVTPVKGLEVLLDAIGIAARSSRRLHLLVVGDGAERARLEVLARERSLPVSWAGFLNQSEMPLAYAVADFLVLPSRSETWGLVVNEAMACGLPAVVSDAVGCVPDLVLEDETGWIHPAGAAPALASRLAEAAADRAELARRGAAARRRVLEGYTVERAVAGTVAALESVVAGRGHP